jgi:hypothetical protein
VGSWDISYLPTKIKGIWLYLYLVVDVWSRKIVAWDVEEKKDPKITAKLVTRACLSEQISRRRQQPLILHADEQAPQRHPRRWTSASRCWHQPKDVSVNQPPYDPVIQSATLALAAKPAAETSSLLPITALGLPQPLLVSTVILSSAAPGS